MCVQKVDGGRERGRECARRREGGGRECVKREGGGRKRGRESVRKGGGGEGVEGRKLGVGARTQMRCCCCAGVQQAGRWLYLPWRPGSA